ncbi:serpentine type 7TM GPCR chemoreceptor srbc domain-containing protein [Ditylenchus destructor]|uniref:Serpentine type 7TM GPCR chemoreceptor srbc domain-containing protein n=1 Tax=Ditylenchus destructor TaxID=166010 RepID=A0AAD4QXR0_9BILA|nr:serpentine type 7TM GPCR chemoreceptor srbc domain-containing protein [Ditylenchus destructor]
MTFLNWLILAEYAIGGCAYTYSLCVIIRILRRIWDGRKTLSISHCLLIYFICWSVSITTSYPPMIYVFIQWSPNGIRADPYALFWTSIPSFSLSPCIPVAVFFLTFERLSFTMFPLFYLHSKWKWALTIVTILSIVLCYCSNFVALYQELPLLPEAKKCSVVSCVFLKTGLAFFTTTKTCVSALNFVVGLIFLYKFWQTTRHIHLNHQTSASISRRRTNKVALFVICLDFFLNFLPQLSSLFLLKVFGVSLASFLGSYNFVFQSIDIVVSSMIYSSSIKKKKSKETITFVKS